MDVAHLHDVRNEILDENNTLLPKAHLHVVNEYG